MRYDVEFWSDKERKSFDSIEELKDYCCSKYSVQRFQVKIDREGNVRLYDKKGEVFAFPCKIIN